MKTYIKYISLLALIATGLSCKQDLQEYNPAGSTAQTLFTTPEGIEAGVNGVYSYNRYFYGKEEGQALMEMGTDIWTNAANNGNTGTNGLFPQPPLMTYQGLTTDNVWVKTRMWQQCYAAINLANNVLKYLPSAGVPAARQKELEGESRFLRAWYYWHLVESFGPVPLQLEPTETILTTATRTPVDAVYEQIFQDLQFAVTAIPLTTTDYGRITRPASEAFLAKVYLTRGKNQEASNYAKKVITGYSYKLLPTYASLWSITGQQNTEVLWSVNYSTNLAFNAGSNLNHTLFLMEYNTQPGMKRDVANGFPNVRYMPTLFLLNLFNEQNDSRYNASFKSAWKANETDATKRPAGMNVGDTAVFTTKYPVTAAFRQSKKYKIYDVNDMYKADGTPNDRFHYVSLQKFDDPTRATDTETQSARDAYILRLGEMYLIAAEALFNLGKKDSAAYYVNEIRTRAAVPGRQANMRVAAADVTLDFILDERARELAGEQVRWFDLKRTNKLVERAKKYNPDAAPNIQPFHVLRPIPQSEIDAVTNKNDFKQNAGY
ncbi:RagB/SusD family nutrient uptake outer membrane protein [Spirosoma endbachense]|uniref:RagB/SusD family nutrient uptake outer membrane protein n=1 Tax=Spirosoma endbachense TaxID=2666025 RepID=A0A6P1W6H0_9BACT|nr:RagB/SusD family nutrient uptake outer membrane protein [Spirosoma endbachense]QHV99952.1 RagB/SusD family nutrient uptake outer membrane protein [Spirosoma endbachense]